MGFGLNSLKKLVNNVGSGLGDLANNPIKAVNDGLNDEATLTALALAGGAYLGGPALFSGAGEAGASGAFVPGFDAMGAGTAAAGAGADAATMAGVMGSAGAGAGADAVVGAGASPSGWMSYLTSPQGISSATQAIGSGLSAVTQAGAVKDSAAQMRAATDAAIGEQRRQFDLTRGDYAPYRAAGAQALTQLQTDINGAPTAADVMSDPGYTFGLQQGQQAIDRKTAAAGGRVSGAALKAAGQYATDYATTGYGAAYQRRQDRLNRLAALAGVGQTATSGTAAAGANSSNQISSAITGQGNAAGAATLARGNIWGNAMNQIGAIGQRWATTPTTTTPG